MKGVLIGLGIFVAIILIVGLSLYGWVNGVRNDGIQHETRLTAQYLDNQNYLSAYVSGFYEQLGIANLKSEKLDQILSDAVRGRYDKGGFNVGSSFFTGIMEAYPNLAGLDVYDKVVNYVAAGREGYRATQSKLLDMLRAYDSWRETGIVKSQAVRMLGFPSSRLEARIGDQSLKGVEARDRMYRIVLAPDALKAYESGTMEPLKVLPSK
ncbi:MAG: hypothetical protein HYV47_00125 [Candidatus Nealsonbacteria bacterium]|nr:hypothetical protein [Candidatus Nealsonbacteria bacterium]